MTTVSRRTRTPLPAVAGLGIAAGLIAVSFGHIFEFVRNAGADVWESIVVAATVDGLIVMSLATIAQARRHGVKPPPIAKAALLVGVTATGGANLVHGIQYGWEGVAVAVWIPLVSEVAYLLAMAALRIGQTPVATARPVICGPATVTVETAMADVRARTAGDTVVDTEAPNPRRAAAARTTLKRPTTAPAPRGTAIPERAAVVQLDAREQAVAAVLDERAADLSAPPVTGEDVADVLTELSGRKVSGRTGRRVLQRVTKAKAAKAKAAKSDGRGDDSVASRTASGHDRTHPADTVPPATGRTGEQAATPGHTDTATPELLPLGA